jgi:hypothetical protein
MDLLENSRLIEAVQCARRAGEALSGLRRLQEPVLGNILLRVYTLTRLSGSSVPRSRTILQRCDSRDHRYARLCPATVDCNGEPGKTGPNTRLACMTQPHVTPERRLYNMMQHLMVLAASQKFPQPAAARNLVTRDDALDAVLGLAAVIDEATHGGRIPEDRGVAAAATLMIIRDYIQPLPLVPGEDGTSDRVASDLAEVLRALRQESAGGGIQG